MMHVLLFFSVNSLRMPTTDACAEFSHQFCWILISKVNTRKALEERLSLNGLQCVKEKRAGCHNFYAISKNPLSTFRQVAISAEGLCCVTSVSAHNQHACHREKLPSGIREYVIIPDELGKMYH